jgi:4,5-dihydroxyphthalate decarboxylase
MLKLKFACQPYDWTKPIMDGSVQPKGIEIAAEVSRPARTFERTLKHGEFDVAEMGLSYYVATLDASDPPFVAIPIFPVRLFRLASIYVSVKSNIHSPLDLRGKRFGEVHTFGHDAGIWARGILRDHHGVTFDCHSSYFIGGVGQPSDKWGWLPPEWTHLTGGQHIGSDRTLDAMLAAGEIDVLFSVIEPPTTQGGFPAIRRLFEESEAVERDYFRKTGVFPIMHTIVIRKSVYREHPWIAKSLYRAFEEAKAKVLEREKVREYVPFTRMRPLYAEHQREVIDLMGEDYWPYGIDANRKTLDAFLGYHHDLGLSKRRFQPDDIFLADAATW